MAPTNDYAALLESLANTVNPLANNYIWPEWITLEDSTKPFFGGYGDVRPAYLKLPQWGPGERLHIAVKSLRPAGDALQRLRVYVAFGRELKVWADLHHENVSQFVGFHINVERDEAWLMSLWEPLGNVVTYLAHNGANVGLKKRLELALDVAKGLAYLHGRVPPVCHGDLKGANVLVNAQHRAILCDLGLARALDEQPTGLTTINFASKGTSRYMSPERLKVSGAMRTLESDMWACGGVFLEILTGDIPYKSLDDYQVVLPIAMGKPPADVNQLDIPANVKTLLEGCWNPDPESRLSAHRCSEKLKFEIDFYQFAKLPMSPAPSSSQINHTQAVQQRLPSPMELSMIKMERDRKSAQQLELRSEYSEQLQMVGRGPTPSQVTPMQHAVQPQQQLINRTPSPGGWPRPFVLGQQIPPNVARNTNVMELMRNGQLDKMSADELKKMGWPEEQVEIFEAQRTRREMQIRKAQQ